MDVIAIEYTLAHGQAAALRKFPAAKQSTLHRWMPKRKADPACDLALTPDGIGVIVTDMRESAADLRAHNGRIRPAAVFDCVRDWLEQMRAASFTVSSVLLRAQILYILYAGILFICALLYKSGGWLA